MVIMHSINVTNCVFKGNTAVTDVANGQRCSGGALYVSDSTLGIAGSSFTGNFADSGGAISSGELLEQPNFASRAYPYL